MGPFKFSSSIYCKYNGPAHEHWGCLPRIIMGPFKNIGSIYYISNGPIHKHWKLPKKLWAHSNSAAASTIKIMGPSNAIGKLLGTIVGPFNNISSIFQQHVWAQPIVLAELLLGPFNTIGKGSQECLAAHSAILATLFGSMVGPIQYYLQHLSVASLSPFNNIGNFFQLHLWAYTLPLAVISHYHRWAHPIILRKFLSGSIHNIWQFWPDGPTMPFP